MELIIGPAVSLLIGSIEVIDKVHKKFYFKNKGREADLRRLTKTLQFKERQLYAQNGGEIPDWFPKWKKNQIDDIKSKVDVYCCTKLEDGSLIVPTGLVPSLKAFLTDSKINLKINDTRDFESLNRRNLKGEKPRELRKPQILAIDAVANPKPENLQGVGLIEMATGCHARDTGILMYNGQVKMVQDIEVGDLLMGPDSKPRKVLSLVRGRDRMFKITPIKGEPFIVNHNHILSLQRTSLCGRKNEGQEAIMDYSDYASLKWGQKNRIGKNPIINISVADYINESKTFKHSFKLYRKSVEFNTNMSNHLIDPYILGVWLGDGSSSGSEICSMDREVYESWIEYGKTIGLQTSSRKESKASSYRLHNNGDRKNGNAFSQRLKSIGVFKNKHIPETYLLSSREDRLSLLAGLIDTDGHLHGGCYELTLLPNKLSHDIIFLARSLGYQVTSREKSSSCQTGVSGIYNRIIISGNISEIPVMVARRISASRKQAKDVSRVGFYIEEVPEDDFFGFRISGDHLYLTSDFIVHHNCGKTAFAQETIRNLGHKAIFLVPSRSILNQTLKRFKEAFGENNVKQYGDGKKNIGFVTVATYQSVYSGDAEDFADIDVMLADECHHISAETFYDVAMNKLKNASYRIGLTAHKERADGSTMLIEAACGPVIYEYSASEAIEDGYLARPTFTIYSVTETSGQWTKYKINSKTKKREATKVLPCIKYDGKDDIEAYRNWILGNDILNSFVAQITTQYVSEGKSVLILIDEKEHGDKLVQFLPDAGFVMGGGKDNEDLLKSFNARKLKILIGTSTIGEGTDTVPVDVLIQLQGGASASKTLQADGRALRNDPDPDTGIPRKPTTLIIDFDFPDCKKLHSQALSRIKMHSKIGKINRSNLE
jgi:superfamily II DNA or RNA helicase